MMDIFKNAVNIIDEEKLTSLVNEFEKTGKLWSVKVGFDPTSADIHLGHTVLLNQLAIFQKHGAYVELIIGDFTASIGDPTGKNKTRKVISEEQIIENAKTYQEQVFKILDESRTHVHFNSNWLLFLSSSELITLASEVTVSRMLDRNDFENRFKNQTPIALHEFLYPLLQGYDSVVLDNDVEIGGTDQEFNLLMGRTIQKAFNKKQQAVMTFPILEGLDGVQKMSKSLNNYIGVNEEPNQMFAKIMSISDELMWRWFELLSFQDIEEMKALHPKEAKMSLAFEITERFHGVEQADIAKTEFNNIFKNKQLPQTIEEFHFEAGTWLAKAFVKAKLCPSTSEFRRNINTNAIKLDGNPINELNTNLEVGEFVAQFGKKKFAKFIIKENR